MAKKDKKAPPPEADMSDGPDGAEGEGAPAKKKPPLMILIAAGVGALVVLGGGGAAAYFMFLKPKPAEHAEAGGEHGAAAGEHGKKDKKKDKKEEGGHGATAGATAEAGAAVLKEGPDGVYFYTLPDVVVNMQSATGRPTFLKLKLTLELPDEAVAETLSPNMPRLQDMFQTFLRELRPEDLAGSQGSYQLRQEILRRVNLVAAPQKINAVLIEEMLVN